MNGVGVARHVVVSDSPRRDLSRRPTGRRGRIKINCSLALVDRPFLFPTPFPSPPGPLSSRRRTKNCMLSVYKPMLPIGIHY